MTDSNLTRVSYITEVTIGTTPGTPDMQEILVTSENLAFPVDTVQSDFIRSNRLIQDQVRVNARANGGFNFENYYGGYDDFIESAMFSTWQQIARIYNATSDSSITQVTNSSDTYTVAAGGASFVEGHLARTTGFTNSVNNSIFRVASSTSTTVVMGGTPTLVDEAAPPAGAKIEAVGFRGASADITATSTGLGSTLLDFTTLGLAVGQWIKIGGTSSGTKFATAVLNRFCRITAIAANALTLDNRGAGWTTDSGTGKTVSVWFGNYIRQGTTEKAFTIEKGFMGQAVPTYHIYKGMEVNTWAMTTAATEKVTSSFTFLGYDEDVSTTSLDSSPASAITASIMTGASNVGYVNENGSIVSANYVESIDFNLNNNKREINALGTLGLVDTGTGTSAVTGTLNTYYNNSDLYAKYNAGTATSINYHLKKDGNAQIFTFPNVKFDTPSGPNAGGLNQDVKLGLPFTALEDTTTATSFQVDRFPYFEE